MSCELCNSAETRDLKTTRSSKSEENPDSLVELFWDPLSQPSRSVKVFLEVCGIPHTDKIVHIKYGENLEPAFKKISGLGRLPVIKDGKFILGESAAIYEYLGVKFRHLCPLWLYPSEVQQRCRVSEYLHWHHNNLRLNAALLFQEIFVKPKMMGKIPNEEKTSRCLKGLDVALKELEQYFLAEKVFILSSEQPSVSDLHAVCEVMQLIAIGMEFKKSLKIQFWIEKTRRSFNPFFDEIHSDLFELKWTLSNKL